MTLVLTEISVFGIAMAADSAVTMLRDLPNGKRLVRVLVGIKKLQQIQKLQAGISVWGEGKIAGIDSDFWLDQFIKTRENEYDSLGTFAALLEGELRDIIPEIDLQKDLYGTIGFHLAGFVDFKGERTPTFYHIHNGRSEALERRGIEIDARRVNANHDLPPELAHEYLDKERVYTTSNGDYRLYREIFERLETFFQDLAKSGKIVVPLSLSLRDRAEWLRFEIETMASLYKMMGIRYPGIEQYVRLPTIGGYITTLSISQKGIESYETR